MRINDWFNRNSHELVRLSDAIWGYAETALNERKSSKLLSDFLEQQGFSVDRNISGLQTAFRAVWGKGEPSIAFLGEYDALSGLSQKPLPYIEKNNSSENGHGCGHNLLGVGTLGAALALKHVIEQENIEGSVFFYGCPAEETMTGKILMEADGVFDDLDLALSWHPSTENRVMENDFLAMKTLRYTFNGISAHAAASPEKGRSALDAVELMNVGVNYLREHVPDDVRIHYSITDGGTEPNIVPPLAKSLYYIRALKWKTVEEVVYRINKIAEGAALMTETDNQIEQLTDCRQFIHNSCLERLLHDCMLETPAQRWSSEDIDFGKRIGKTLDKNNLFGNKEKGFLDNKVYPLSENRPVYFASTDVANVSWKVPTGQIWTSCVPFGVPAHTWQFTSSVGMSIGHRGMLYAAEVLARVSTRFIGDKNLQEQIKNEFYKKLKKQG